MYLTEDNINADPFKQFDIWFKDAHDIGTKKNINYKNFKYFSHGESLSNFHF